MFLPLAAEALDWCGASRADPLPLEGLRERSPPAAVAYIRATASRAGVLVRQACQDLARCRATQRHNNHFGTQPKRSP